MVGLHIGTNSPAVSLKLSVRCGNDEEQTSLKWERSSYPVVIPAKIKGKVHFCKSLRLCTVRTAHWGSRGIALLFYDHGTVRGWGVSVTPWPLFTPGKTRYPLYRRLGWPQGRSGQVRKISPPLGFDPRTVQPVASRYTDYATRPTIPATFLTISALNNSGCNEEL